MPRKSESNSSDGLIAGKSGDDLLSGLGGSFILSGGRGDDTYVVDDLGDIVSEKNNGGRDRVVSSIDWTLGENVEDLTLTGTADLTGEGNSENNELVGNVGDNILDGADGDDEILAGGGDDLLIGGSGSDLLDGGEGTDGAVFSGLRTDYRFEYFSGDLFVTSLMSGETDTVRNVEYLRFDDGSAPISEFSQPEVVPAVANDDTAFVAEDSSVNISVLENDLGAAISVSSVGQASHGTVVLKSDGTVTYRPASNYNGSDSFSYTITDGSGQSSTGTVTVDVTAVNDAPIAHGDLYTIVSDQISGSIGSVLGNDEDADGDALSVIGAGANQESLQATIDAGGHYVSPTAAGGEIHIAPDGTFSYTPPEGFLGTDSFSYAVSDGQGEQSIATVEISIEASVAQEPPVPTDTSAYYIDGLIYGDPYRLNAGVEVGTATVVTYAFADILPDYYDGSSSTWSTFEAFSPEQQEVTRGILNDIEGFANLTFVEAPVSEATIVFGLADLGGFNGLAYRPEVDGIGDTASDVWIDNFYASLGVIPGTAPYVTLLHEIGHSLGLDHADLPIGEETQQYTVMEGLSNPTFPVAPEGYQLYDVAALQYLYGANTNSQTDDNVYAFGDLAGKLKTIWDAGGHDFIDMSAASYGTFVDLREGQFSTIAEAGANNVTLAFGSIIEDATGGSHADTIIGNDVANRLDGGLGDDVLYGKGGADIFAFGASWGQDVIADFSVGEDLLDLSAAQVSFDALEITTEASDTVITDGDNSITLLGVTEIDETSLLVA